MPDKRTIGACICDGIAVLLAIGRWLGRFPAADKLFEVEVELNDNQQAGGLIVACRVDRNQWTRQAHGAYLLRTNCTEKDPARVSAPFNTFTP